MVDDFIVLSLSVTKDDFNSFYRSFELAHISYDGIKYNSCKNACDFLFKAKRSGLKGFHALNIKFSCDR